MNASSGSGEWPRLSVHVCISHKCPYSQRERSPPTAAKIRRFANLTNELATHNRRPHCMASAPTRDSQLWAETRRTEFLPPKGLATLSFAFGSGSHCPSTTNRYSYRPGFTVRSPTHRPLPRGASGVFSGCHSLKEPATQTRFAPGLTNSRETRFALVELGFAVFIFAASVFVTSGLAKLFFGLFVVLIIVAVIVMKQSVLTSVQ